MLCLRAESVLFAENTMLLHLQGENTSMPDTLRVASLYAGLCADCPFGTWGLLFRIFRPLLALHLLHLRKKVVTLHLSIKSILFNSIFMNEDTLSATLSLILLLVVLTVLLCLYILLPAKMAKKRGRSTIGWIALFWVISPLWGTIALLVLGDSKKKLKQDLSEYLHDN